jgi:hypothetical protein
MEVFMLREPFEISLEARGLEKVLHYMRDGVLKYHPLWTPVKIAREVLNQAVRNEDFMREVCPDEKIGDCTFDFGTSCRLEKKLTHIGIGGDKKENNLLNLKSEKCEEGELQTDSGFELIEVKKPQAA